MKKLLTTAIVALIVIAVLAAFGCNRKDSNATKKPGDAATSVSAGATGGDLPAVYAKVGDVEIKKEKVEDIINRQKALTEQQGHAVNDTMVSFMRQRLLDELVTMELVMQEAKKQNLVATDEEVMAIYNEEMQKAGGPEKFNEMLTQLKFTPEEAKDFIRQKLTIQKLGDKITASLTQPTEEEMKKFYDENKERYVLGESVHAYHILKKVDPTAPPEKIAEVETLMKDILKKAKAPGADFSQLAKENSEDGSAQNGGDLGFGQKGQWVPEFETAAFGLKPGQVSDIVKSQFGFHIIKVTEKKAAETKKYEDVKEEIKNILISQKKDAEFKTYIDNIKKDANVQIFLKSEMPQMPMGHPGGMGGAEGGAEGANPHGGGEGANPHGGGAEGANPHGGGETPPNPHGGGDGHP